MVVDRSFSIHIDPPGVQFIRVNHRMAHAGRVVEEKIEPVGVLPIADAEDPMPLGQIGFRLRRVVQIVAAVLGGRPRLQRHHDGMARSQHLLQAGKRQGLRCGEFDVAFFQKGKDGAGGCARFGRCAKQLFILRQVQISVVGGKPVHQHLHAGCAAGVVPILAQRGYVDPPIRFRQKTSVKIRRTRRVRLRIAGEGKQHQAETYET